MFIPLEQRISFEICKIMYFGEIRARPLSMALHDVAYDI